MAYVSAFILLAVVILYLFSRNRFGEEMSLARGGPGLLWRLLPVGLQLGALFRHKYNTGYERKLEIKLRELKGEKAVRVHVKLHIAEKIVLLLLCTAFLSFVGARTEAGSSFAVFSLICLGALFYATDRRLDEKIKDRRREMQTEFPEFLNKLILLVNAGLTVSGAIRKIVKDNKKGNPLYMELGSAIHEIDSGKPESQAYEEFGKRCRLQDAAMFSAALIQNLRKGNDELIPILRLQAATCWENRKNIARKQGEEASTKLILPMTIIFIAILLMLITPAVLQLKF